MVVAPESRPTCERLRSTVCTGPVRITCVTAQNTVAVGRVDALPAESVVAQIEAVTSDFQIRAAKTGMLLNRPIILAISQVFARNAPPNLVIDPVMVARSGDKLIDDHAISALVEELLPQAAMTTPNRYEAQLLAQMEINTLADMKTAAKAIHSIGPEAVLLTGGANPHELVGMDLWYDGHEFIELESTRIETQNTHGAGCTLSAAIAANLALGLTKLNAVRQAKDYVTDALRNALAIGQGNGPLGHFFPLSK